MNIDVNSPFVITLLNAVAMAGLTLWNAIYTRKRSDHEQLKKLLEGKMDKLECQKHQESLFRFKERIGTESELRKTEVVKIQKALIFIVQNMGGDPVAMGLLD